MESSSSSSSSSPRRTSGTKSVIAALLWIAWVVGFVGATSTSGVHDDNTGSSGTYQKSNNPSYNHLRSASPITATVLSSLAGTNSNHDDNDNDNNNNNDNNNDLLLNELKEIVLFLSQKMDDSDVRIRSLEERVRAQEATIKNLGTQVNDATSFHRYLQTADSECLPMFRETAFGPRCDFRNVVSFQNRTFFNDNVVFNENVEFDSNANCMPVFNSTTRMCTYNDDFTFDEGINFENDVRFGDTVKFDADASFRDNVEMRSEVDFNSDRGSVKFRKDVKFTENVLIQNDDHDIEFKLQDKVGAKFYQDKTFEVDTHTTFHQHVYLEDDLEVEGQLRVKKKSELEDLEMFGYLWVDGHTLLESALEVKGHATMKNGLKIESGGLDITNHGAQIVGATNVDGEFKLKGNGLEEPVLTESRMMDLMRSATLSVATLVANEAVINGRSIPRTDASFVQNVLGLLKNQNLNVNSLTSNSANIGGRSYPHTDPPDNNVEITGDEIVNKLRGKSLADLASVTSGSLTTTTATIGGKQYPQSSAPVNVDIDDVVKQLMLYDKPVTIPYLESYHLNMINALKADMTMVQAKILINNISVALSTHVDELEKKIGDIEASGGDDATCTCSADDVSSVVDYNYIANLGFLDELQQGSECTCNIEGVVTKDYISQLGFLDTCPCENVFVFDPDGR